MTFDREQLQVQAADLARQNVYIGTSSWKYPGWRGMLYDPARYEYRGKFAQTRFNRACLREYTMRPLSELDFGANFRPQPNIVVHLLCCDTLTPMPRPAGWQVSKRTFFDPQRR
jgi:hypothetical protein